MRLDFPDFYLGVLPVWAFPMPSLPNFHLPKPNLADRGTNQIKVNKTPCQTITVTLYEVAEEPDWGELREPTSKAVVKKQLSYLEMVKVAIKALKVIIIITSL